MMSEPARAWIGGSPAALKDGVSAAGALLDRSRAPVVAGLGTDAAGAGLAVSLARAIGGSIDHAQAGAGLRNLDVMRRAGWIVTTPLQARARADVVLLVGDGHDRCWPEMADTLALSAPPTLTPAAPTRQVLRVGDDAGSLLATLAAVRAMVNGRATTLDGATEARLGECAAALLGARFGVVVWTADTACDLSIEMICGLIDDLNRTTRCAGLPIAASDNEAGVAAVLAAATGFPARTSFSRIPEHDPWRFDAARLVESGEADAVVWISAITPRPPPWTRDLPIVALVCPGTVFATAPAVAFEVARPGVDEDAILYDMALGAPAVALGRSARVGPSVAAVLGMISVALKC